MSLRRRDARPLGASHGSLLRLPLRSLNRVHAGVLAVTATLAPAGPLGFTAAEPPERVSLDASCEVVALPPQRMLLADGSRVIIDAQSAAASGDHLLVVGQHVHVFAAPASAATTASRPPYVGVVRDADGRLTLVPSPLESRAVTEPQVVAARGGGWHVMFVAGTPGTSLNAFAYDSAEVWYGRYSDGRWANVQRIAHVRAAVLSPGVASAPVLTADGVAFAYPYDLSSERKSNAAGNQGAVVLRQQDAGWVSDTLRTWEAPRSVQLSASDTGGLRMYLSVGYFERPRPRGPALFRARFDSTWTRPTILYEPASGGTATLLAVIPDDAGDVLSWNVQVPEAGRERVEWGIVHGDTLRRAATVTEAQDVFRPAMVPVDSQTMLWLVREGGATAQLQGYIAAETGVRATGVIPPTPLSNFITPAVRLSSGRIIAVAGGADPTAGASPPFVSYLVELVVSCSINVRK